MNTNTIASTEQDQAPRLNVDFSHRLTLMPCFETDEAAARAFDLVETVNEMGDRAKAVLEVMALLFMDDDRTDNDKAIFYTLQTVIREIDDITKTVDAFRGRGIAKAA